MRANYIRTILRVQGWGQVAAVAVFSGAACIAVAMTFLASVGLVPWLELPLSYGGAPVGPTLAQIAVTAILVLLCVFVPSSLRVMRLEAAHREFSLRMDDVARAYWVAHAADRAGLFEIGREYDSVRARLKFLRDHPDLDTLDADLLETAAQMSHEARELAAIYSDDKVARAREILAHRRHTAEELSDRIARAHAVTAEMRRCLDEVETDEDVVRARIARLREELAELMPAIDGARPGPAARRATMGVVPKARG